MKICVFSDIHGNQEAFENMLYNEQKNTDLFIFVGDIFGYFYGQRQIIDTMMSMDNLLAVKGNHDSQYLLRKNDEDLVNRYGSSYTLKLSDLEMQYINSLPEKLEIEIEKKRFGIFHGGYDNYLEQRIYPNENMQNMDWFFKYDFVILGHTHYRLCYKEKNTIVINPGSLGQPRDEYGFSYCVLDTEENDTVFKKVNVNIKKIINEVSIKDKNRVVCSYLQNKYGDMCVC